MEGSNSFRVDIRGMDIRLNVAGVNGEVIYSMSNEQVESLAESLSAALGAVSRQVQKGSPFPTQIYKHRRTGKEYVILDHEIRPCGILAYKTNGPFFSYRCLDTGEVFVRLSNQWADEGQSFILQERGFNHE